MKCVKFRLIQIRNMEDTTILPDEGLTIFTGENGSGKTNLIEAVYYASIGKSFRTGNDNEMIRLGDEEGTILLDFTIRDVSHTIKVKLTRNQGKKIFFNDNPVRKKDLMGLFRTVIFTPDELQLIKGAPVFRRRFLDMEISQVSPRYYAELLRYTRAVQQRNAAFRNARMTGIIPDTDIKTALHFAKGGVTAVQLGSILVNNKELRAGGIKVIIARHRKGTADMLERVVDAIFRKLALNMPITVRHDVIVRRPALNDIILNDAAPTQTIIKTAACSFHKVCHGEGGIFRVQRKNHSTKIPGFNRAAH